MVAYLLVLGWNLADWLNNGLIDGLIVLFVA